MTSHWALQSSVSSVKITQEIKIPGVATLAPVTTSSVYASANVNNYTEMIDQRKMSGYSANSAEGRASTHLWTNQREECKGLSAATARKKSRKSAMPVKINQETRDEDVSK